MRVALNLVFLLVTTPVASHALGRAAYIGGTPMWAGTVTDQLQGVARRNWDITFAGVVPGTVSLSLAAFGIGAVIAVIGGIMYVTIVLYSILTGPRLEASNLLLVAGTNNPLLESTKLTDHQMEDKQNQPKGALALVFIFLVWFAVYYLTNWWLLRRTWFIN